MQTIAGSFGKEKVNYCSIFSFGNGRDWLPSLMAFKLVFCCIKLKLNYEICNEIEKRSR